MSSRSYTATEFGRLFGDAWAGWAKDRDWPEVMAVRKGERQANHLGDYVTSQVMTAIHQFDDDPNQAEADVWQGFVAGVNDLVEGSLDSQDLMRRLEQDED
jgi:hypothetical protein